MHGKHTFIDTFILARERMEILNFQAGFASAPHPCIYDSELSTKQLEEKIYLHLFLIIILVGCRTAHGHDGCLSR